MTEKPLNRKQRIFIDEYLTNGGNATAAYEKAYGKKESARISASRLLSKDNISAEIKRRLADIESEAIADVQEVLKTLTATLRGEISDTVIINVGIGKGCTRAEKVYVDTPLIERISAAKVLMKYYSATSKAESETVTEIKIVRATNKNPTFPSNERIEENENGND